MNLQTCVMAAALFYTGLFVGTSPPARAAGGINRSDPPAPAGGAASSGRWIWSASASCRCQDDSCRTIQCSGESSIGYEDARLKATAALEYKARSENGRIEAGSVSITITFGSRLAMSAAQPQAGYYAICLKAGCRWVGPPRGADLRRAAVDAYGHGSQTGHFCWIGGLSQPPSITFGVVATAGTGFGWWGSAEVRVPGRGVKVVVVKGIVPVPDAATALTIGRQHAKTQAAQFGEITRMPEIQLISPFFLPSIRAGIREDLRPSSG